MNGDIIRELRFCRDGLPIEANAKPPAYKKTFRSLSEGFL
jgi:hypothetical protein